MGRSKKRRIAKTEMEGPVEKLKKQEINESHEIAEKENTVESIARKSGKKRGRERKRRKRKRGSNCEDRINPMNGTSDHEMAVEITKPIEEAINKPKIIVDLKSLFASNGQRPEGSHLHCKDVKDILMFTVLGSGRWEAPKWCDLISWKNVNHTLFIMVSSVSGEDFMAYKECFKNVTEIFPMGYPVKNDGSNGLFVTPLQSYLFYNMKKKSAKRKEKSNPTKKLAPCELVLSEELKLVNEFPVFDGNPVGLSQENNNEWIRTWSSNSPLQSGDESSAIDESRMFAIDCEMCLTSEGKELTRVSVINENLEVVYDTYVKPKSHITDYLTQYSGITPGLLENVHTTVGDVQQRLLEIISPDDIIVGHSLDNDMRALKMYHQNYIDTSVIYGDQRGIRFKPSLKSLVKQYLKREIQNDEMGHCSIEDAKACMELVQLKVEKGSQFGLFSKPNESIIEAFSRAEKKSVILDTAFVARQHCFNLTKVALSNSDDEVVSGTKNGLDTSEFMFAHLRDFERLLQAHDSEEEKPNTSQLKETLTKIDENVQKMVDNVPTNSLVVCLFASGFRTKRIQSLQKDKKQLQSEEVVAAVHKARDCICFIKVKG